MAATFWPAAGVLQSSRTLRCPAFTFLMCSVAALSTAPAADDAAVSNDPPPPATSQPAGRSVSFNDQIRPILSDRCYFCHGPEEDHREAGLRLDDRDAAIEAAAIVPGEPDASL